MLHDLKTAEREETQALLRLDTPSLEALSHILRHRELWPKEFCWCFSDCENCAMGLAKELWEVGRGAWLHYPDNTARLLGIEANVAMRLFVHLSYGPMRYAGTSVTPEYVADTIDNYLAKR